MGRHTLKMASTLSRVCLRGSSLLKNTQAINGTTRTISVSASRSKEERLCPEGIPHATGIEKWEMMAAQAGCRHWNFSKKANSHSLIEGKQNGRVLLRV